MRAIVELERLGYTLTLDNNNIRYQVIGAQPDPATVRPLLAELKEHKPEAVTFLQWRQLPERILIADVETIPAKYRSQYVLEQS